MTLDEARAHIGDGVVYKTGYAPPEDGVITGVSRTSVFVRYAGKPNTQGTNPADLTLAERGRALRDARDAYDAEIGEARAELERAITRATAAHRARIARAQAAFRVAVDAANGTAEAATAAEERN